MAEQEKKRRSRWWACAATAGGAILGVVVGIGIFFATYDRMWEPGDGGIAEFFQAVTSGFALGAIIGFVLWRLWPRLIGR